MQQFEDVLHLMELMGCLYPTRRYKTFFYSVFIPFVTIEIGQIKFHSSKVRKFFQAPSQPGTIQVLGNCPSSRRACKGSLGMVHRAAAMTGSALLPCYLSIMYPRPRSTMPVLGLMGLPWAFL